MKRNIARLLAFSLIAAIMTALSVRRTPTNANAEYVMTSPYYDYLGNYHCAGCYWQGR